MYNPEENELLHEIDSLQRKLKEMTQNYTFEVELCKKVLNDYGIMSLALDMACNALSERTTPSSLWHRHNFLKKAGEEVNGKDT